MRRVTGPESTGRLGNFSIGELKYPAAITALVGAMSLVGALAQGANAEKPRIRQAPPMAYVGFNSNEVWLEDEAKAQAEAKSLAEAGANAVRVEIPIGVGGKYVKPVENRICNAARAARDNNLELIIYLTGRYRDGRHGFLPIRAKEKRDYLSSITNLMWTIAGDKNEDGTGGCAPEVKRINISPINEPNNSYFNNHPDPQKYGELMLYLYQHLHRLAAKPGLEVELNVIGLDISTTARGNPINFINGLAQYLREKRSRPLPMDSLAFHFYARGYDGTTETVNQAAQVQNRKIIEAIRDNFGDSLPLYVTELGAITRDKNHLYKVRVPAGVFTMSGQQQGEFYSHFIKESVCAGIAGIFIFYQTDKAEDDLRSGTKFPNGVRKAKTPIVEQSFADAEAGTVDC